MKKESKKYYIFRYKMELLNLLSFLFFIILAILTYCIFKDYGNIFNDKTTDLRDLRFLIFVIFMFVWLAIHELLHAISYIINGAAIKNIETGIELEKGIMYCSCEQYITKKNIMISAVVPITVIGIITYVISIITNNPYIAIYSIINISGSVGDLALLHLLLKLPNDIEYREFDDPTAFCISSTKDLSNVSTNEILLEEVLEDDNKVTKCKSRGLHISKVSYIILAVILLMILLTIYFIIR